MAIFGVDKEEFDRFQTDVRRRFDALEAAIKSKVTDSEEAAKAAAESAIAHDQKARSAGASIQTALKELEGYKAAALQELKDIQAERASVLNQGKSLVEKIATLQSQYDQFIQAKQAVDAQINDLAKKMQAANGYLEQTQKLPEALANAQQVLSEAKNLGESIKNTLNHAIGRKSDIDELHKRILGEDITNPDGKTDHINGLKDELEKSYRVLSELATELDAEINRAISEITERHGASLRDEQARFNELLASAAARYDAVNKELTTLLPGAMAEGLSAAYEKKKKEEELSLQGFEKSFRHAIYALVGVSLIPFCVDAYLLVVEGKDLVEVIKETPSLIVAILPLYFPVLWLAYSTNKKLNLSKRLIEEYTHKSVLGKTFSGLSNQIASLPHESSVKEELRTRLLFNVLQVSAENPGKLITNYNKSDHPLMEALENSAKLSESVESLSKIPGFSAIAKKLSERSDAILKEQADRVERGVATNDALKEPPENGGGQPA